MDNRTDHITHRCTNSQRLLNNDKQGYQIPDRGRIKLLARLVHEKFGLTTLYLFNDCKPQQLGR